MSQPPQPPERSPDAQPLSQFSHSNSRPKRPLASRLPRWERRTVLVAAAACAALLLVGSGVYALGGDKGDKKARTEAGDPKKPSASATPGRQKPTGPALPQDINAGLAKGEAKAWYAKNEQDLPGDNTLVHDLWFVDGLVIQTLYREVTAYKVADGTKAWSIPLPAAVCDTPVNPTPDGRVVVAYRDPGKSEGTCNHLQMIDLKKGAGGWRKKLDEKGSEDSTIIIHLAITGNTVTVGRNMTADAYQVSDGKPLFKLGEEKTGGCHPNDVAGGPKLLVLDWCMGKKDVIGQIKEVDPKSGKIRWRYQLKDRKTKKVMPWKFGKVYSVDPLVVSVHASDDQFNWSVIALDGKGKLRSSLNGGKFKFDVCAGAGDSGRGTQNCPGGVAGKNTFYLATKSADPEALGPTRIVAFDLKSGKVKWASVPEGKREYLPVAAEGSSLIAYVKGTSEVPGRIVRIGPKGGKPTTVLQFGKTAQPLEYEAMAGEYAYRGGRFFLASSLLSGEDTGEQARLLSYGNAS
ncbi:PQQ-binding-like beta-propeller repeat protein [Streptomyces sp. TRM66268-LWL]|uniref:PQQ-binding-like beta-propeller repeat protein n=1 Tax=Streptomyces polyasparticus TaxID=2767826 RepID=A0ABR7SCX5_9ACTN|nr:PQQ-binding-like beta-propeller repeat protein [Streptomyces polyasparticus]MBC9712829.1 PQQ-binding-like beta-propeller repeat protein [Streptomyces polyasparticus]